MQRFTIRPVLWDYQKNSREIYSLKIAATVNRKVTYILTGYQVHKTQWDKKKLRVIGHENADVINVAIRRQIADLERSLIAQSMEGVPITKNAIRGSNEVSKTFALFAREVRADEKEINRVQEFEPGVLLSSINVTWLRRYEQHERKRGIAHNTLNTSFKYLRRILNQAHAEKLIKENPFDAYEIPKYRQTERTYLTKEELQLVMATAADLTGQLRITAWFFLLGCYSGLRHSDWVRFNYDTMVEGQFLKLRAKKNKKHVVLPIGKTLGKILKVVRTLPHPVSNQKCNVMLKAIGSTAKIKKPLTTHVARHSFGYLCASNKIPKSVTAELMGVHTSTVEVYYHLSGQNIIDQAAPLLHV